MYQPESSLVLMIYASVRTCIIKKHVRGSKGIGLQKSFKKIFIFLKFKNFLTLVNADNFQFDFRQILVMCSSNVNSLFLVILKSLTVLVSHIILLPILVHKRENLFPEIKKGHFPNSFSYNYSQTIQ